METAFNAYYLHVAVIGIYYALLASSWNVIAGMTGFATYSHAAFAALGAYASAYFSMHLGWPLPAALLFSALVGAGFGALLGKLCLRLSGTYLALITLAFSELLRLVLTNEDQWTRGTLGLQVPMLRAEIAANPVLHKLQSLALFTGALMLLLLAIRYLRRSRPGLHLRAILSDELAAATLGVRTERLRILVFSGSSAVASLAGALYGHYLGLISPDMGNLSQMFLVLAMTVLGGLGTFWGPVLGAVLLEFLSEAVRDAGQAHVLIYAAIVLLIYRFRPEGILGARR
jgi:branched-chain amino acid transport system permease protein